MKKIFQLSVMICTIFIASFAINAQSTVQAASANLQATAAGKTFNFKTVQAALYSQLNEGITYTIQVKDHKTNKWISLKDAVIVKVSASKELYFANEKDADQYIKTYKKDNKVTLKKTNVKTLKQAAENKYKKEAPAISLKASKKEPTNKNVTVTVTVKDNKKVALTKWAKGNKNAQQFTKNDTTLKGNKFTVTENGTYTVYAIDNDGNKRTKSIKITNIDKEKPTITLTPSTTETTNKNVTVKTKITDNDKVVTVKYAKNVQNIAYFKKSGTVVKNNSITIKNNGTYTVYAKDRAGNEQIQTITIANIDNAAPEISIVVNEEDTTAVSKKIQVTATDENGIKDQKWAFGDHDAEYFATKGSRISPLQNANQKDKIMALRNGIYTIYAEDTLGNKTVKKVTIDGVEPFTEVTQVGVQCEVCRMDLHNTDPNKVYSTKAIDHEGHTHYFCRIGCLLHQESVNGVEFVEKYVRDYSADAPRQNNWIPLEDAITVKFKADETAKGIMGWKVFHFKDITSAANYLGTSKDQVVVEKLENFKEYTKTNHRGMNYEYEADKVVK